MAADDSWWKSLPDVSGAPSPTAPPPAPTATEPLANAPTMRVQPDASQAQPLSPPPIPPDKPPPPSPELSGTVEANPPSRAQVSKDDSWWKSLPDVSAAPSPYAPPARSQPSQESLPSSALGSDAYVSTSNVPASQTPIPDWVNRLKDMGESSAAFVNAIPSGVVGQNPVDYAAAGLGGLWDTATKGQPLGQAFHQRLAQEQAASQQAKEQYPVASGLGQAGGALGAGAMLGPLLAWGTVPASVGALGRGAAYMGGNAAYGAGMAALNNDSPLVGAGVGAALPGLHMLGSGAYHALAPLVSPAAREARAAADVAGRVGGAPIQPSPIPGVPYNLAQATGSQPVKDQMAQAMKIQPGMAADLAQRQAAGIVQHIGQIGTPGAPKQSMANVAENLRTKVAPAIDQHEQTLWQRPEMQSKVSRATVEAHVNQAVQSLPPGLRPGVTGNIQTALDHLHGLPDQVSLSDLNSVNTMLRLAGKPTESNPWSSAVSGRLRSAFANGVEQATRAPGVPPAARASYQQALAFTELKHRLLDTPEMKAVLKGDRASKAGRAIFSQIEGPRNLAQISDMLLQVPKGAQAARELKEATVNAVASEMQKAIAGDKGSVQKLATWMAQNKEQLRDTGILNQNQAKAWDELDATLAKLTQRNPPAKAGEKFIDDVIPSWVIKGVSYAHALFNVYEGRWGAAAESAFLGRTAGREMSEGIAGITEKIAEIKAEIFLDPDKLKALNMKNTPANHALMKPAVRNWFDASRIAIENQANQIVSPLRELSGTVTAN